MALEKIINGTLADPDIINKNFEYLDNRITDTNNKLSVNFDNKFLNIETSLSSVQQNTQNSISGLQTNFTQLQSTVQTNANTAINKRRPNWNAGIILATGVNHIISSDGWILFRNAGVDQATWYINSNVIGQNYGLMNYWQDCNSCLCPVSAGNAVRTTAGLIQFFPTL